MLRKITVTHKDYTKENRNILLPEVVFLFVSTMTKGQKVLIEEGKAEAKREEGDKGIERQSCRKF